MTANTCNYVVVEAVVGGGQDDSNGISIVCRVRR